MWQIPYIAKLVTPVVAHGLDEFSRYDKRVVHILYETAVISYLVAMGYPAQMAIKIFEDYEKNNGILDMYEDVEYYRRMR